MRQEDYIGWITIEDVIIKEVWFNTVSKNLNEK